VEASGKPCLSRKAHVVTLHSRPTDLAHLNSRPS
jgi:hypothetical protein